MYVTELDNFVQKFHQLWKAGVSVHLDLETHAGHAWVGIRAQLDHAPGPVQPLNHPFSSRSPHRSPSYQRRQERRRQAAQAAAQTGSLASQVSGQKPSEEMPAAEASIQSKTVEKEGNNCNLANQAKVTFSCDLCDFTSNWKNGLTIHMTRKYDRIEQLDGCGDDEENDKYLSSGHYWKKGWIGTVFQTYLDADDVIDKSNLNEEEKQVEKNKVLEARKLAFGTGFEFFPPWSTN
jgi:hypothetical protein